MNLSLQQSTNILPSSYGMSTAMHLFKNTKSFARQEDFTSS